MFKRVNVPELTAAIRDRNSQAPEMFSPVYNTTGLTFYDLAKTSKSNVTNHILYSGNSSARSFYVEVYLESVFLFVFFILAFTGNVAIIFALWRGRLRSPAQKLSSISLLYSHLAIADLIAAFCCILSNAIIYLVEDFLAGDGICKLLRFLQKLGLAGSTFVVVVISVDRCCAVMFPLHKHQLRRIINCMIWASWIAAILFSLPQVNILASYSQSSGDILQCDDSAGYAATWQTTLYALCNLILLYIFPIIGIAVCYALIVYTVNQEIKTSQGCIVQQCTSTQRTLQLIKAKKTSLAVSVVVVMTFILSWAPWYVTLTLHLTGTTDPAYDFCGNHAICFCGLGHSVMNPLLYGAYNLMRRKRDARSFWSCGARKSERSPAAGGDRQRSSDHQHTGSTIYRSWSQTVRYSFSRSRSFMKTDRGPRTHETDVRDSLLR